MVKNRMRFEKSCGAVVYTRIDDKIKYMLIREKNGFWVFPKGHMEFEETEHETARREIKEETSIDVRFIDGFRYMDEHSLAREGHPEIMKQTIFFLAEYERQDYYPQESEIAEIELVEYELAMEKIQLDNFKRILVEADLFLKQKIE